ncbi:MAG: cytochrome c [Sphingobacteriales bacterium]|nr:cytochrome c [Sphingobacteriales bacterium]
MTGDTKYLEVHWWQVNIKKLKSKLVITVAVLFILFNVVGCIGQNEKAKLSSSINTDTEPGNALDQTDWPEKLKIGRIASPAEIAAKDIDVRPDGTGLPPGSGTAIDGKAIYLVKCASCHGQTGIEGPENQLVLSPKAQATGKKQKDSKVIGNYWPYATTLYDYINRAMPFNAPGSLTSVEVYNLTAYLLYANKIIKEGQLITAKSLPLIEMPAKNKFVADDRRGGAEIR